MGRKIAGLKDAVRHAKTGRGAKLTRVRRKKMWAFHIHGCLMAKENKKALRAQLISMYGDAAGAAIPLERIAVTWSAPAPKKTKGSNGNG